VTPSGKKVARVHLTLTKKQRADLVTKLNDTGPVSQDPIGGWAKTPRDTSNPIVGDKYAMRTSQSQGWWIDKNGTEPTHTVTKVETHQEDATAKLVTMTNNSTGEEISTKFNPDHTVQAFNWDPTIMAPPPAPGQFKLSPVAQAQGWNYLTNDGGMAGVKGPGWTPSNPVAGSHGNGILQVEPGNAVPMGKAAIEYGYNDYSAPSRRVLRKISQNGVVIEMIGPDSEQINSMDGLTTVTLPAGSDGSTMAGAMSDLGIDYSPMTREGAKVAVRGQLRNMLSFDMSNVDTPKNLSDDQLFSMASDSFGIPDLGWQDVSLGVDESTGKVTFFWSKRVYSAIAAKSKHDLVVRGGKGHSAESIVNQVVTGGAGGTQRRVAGMVYIHDGNTHGKGISEDTDASHMAGSGSYTSAYKTSGFLPAHNPLQNGFGGYTIYSRPEAVLGRIQDVRGANHDAFGVPGSGVNTLKKVLNAQNMMDYYVGGGTPPETIAFIAVQNPSFRTQAIAKLHTMGIFQLNGVPLEQAIVTQSHVTSIATADMPPVGPPTNARPILDLPESYDEAAPAAEAVAAP
jgi:hypothetical protein